jgi:hypothetical protein
MSDFSLESPSHLRELLDVPCCWSGVNSIPDSVEALVFRLAVCATFSSLLKFFFQFASRSLKVFRAAVLVAFVRLVTPFFRTIRSCIYPTPDLLIATRTGARSLVAISASF